MNDFLSRATIPPQSPPFWSEYSYDGYRPWNRYNAPTFPVLLTFGIHRIGIVGGIPVGRILKFFHATLSIQ